MTARGKRFERERQAGIVVDSLTLGDIKALGTESVDVATEHVSSVLGILNDGFARQVAKRARVTFHCLSRV